MTILPAFALNWLRRWLGLSCASIAWGGFAYAVFAQYVQGMVPCPLCMTQRYALAGMGLMFAVASFALQRRWISTPKLFSPPAALFGFMGIAAAIWQLQLQYGSGDKILGCSDPKGLLGWLARTFGGSGDCGEAGWLLFGVSATVWTLALFVVLTAAAVAWPYLRAGASPQQ